ncbi:hypothetical protein L210DRAFT_3640792 [Boletus edulis BED1]|uniref:Uncharacterized protein n=1 Tax=Boletus edulis BED1 TaxID=1328754 RepID=A0AAD4GLD8_BOLED|nr:hypothetical protein L210DRAFT_3640792 [Boletus edulis BED1]
MSGQVTFPPSPLFPIVTIPLFTLADIKLLKKELSKFVINEGQTLNKDEKGYIEVMWSVILNGVSKLCCGGSKDGWMDEKQRKRVSVRTIHDLNYLEPVRYLIAKQSTSGEDPHAAEAQVHERRNSNKRPPQDGPEDGCTAKWLQGMNNAIIEFHVKFLLNLLKDKHALANRVVILQQAL